MKTPPAASAGTNPRLLLFTIAIGTTLAPLNSTMIAVALPDIQRAFDASVTSTAWLVALYLIAMAVGQPVGGRLGDLYGRRPVYLIGLVWFGVASLGCAFAPGLEWLILFRLQQALAGTLVFPNGAALIRETLPSERRGMAFGMIGLAASGAAASGPPIGGILVELLGWSSIFWMNVPLTGLALLLGWRALPYKPRTAQPKTRFDIGGVVLLSGALSALILTPTFLKMDLLAIAALAMMGGIGLGWAFVRWEQRVPAPIVDVALFARSHFTAACASILLGNLVMYSTLLAIPLYMEGVRGESVRTTGLVLAAMSAFAALATPLGGRWSDRFGRWLPAVTGATLVLGGTILLTVGVYGTGTVFLVIALAVLGIGLGVAGAPVQTAAVESVPAGVAGSASGIYSTARYVGSVIGSSVLATMFATQPGANDGGRFVLLFAGLAVVALAGIIAHANIADRRPIGAHADSMLPQER